MVLYWSVYLVGLYVILSFGHGIVVQMFENIPEANATFAIVVAIGMLMALLVVYSQFVSNKKDELVKKKLAKLNDEVYDEVNGTISQKMFWGYPVLAIIAAAILSTIVLLVINEVAVSQYAEYVSTQTRIVVIGAVAELILFALIDRFYLRAAMDGLFFEKVEKPATEKFLDGVAPIVEGVVEEMKQSAEEILQTYLDAGFTEAQALARMKKQ